MIGYLKGELAGKQPPVLIIDVQGVGYEVEAPMSTFYRLPAVGSQVKLLTHFVVREDAQLLYGFSTEQERMLFRTLIKVNGVGPKMALTILSGIEAEDFARCIAHDDTATLVRLPGVGKKTAERLIVEMRDKMKDWSPESPTADFATQMPGLSMEPIRGGRQEAESALIALGYKPAQATKAIADAVKTVSEDDVEGLIRQSLKAMI